MMKIIVQNIKKLMNTTFPTKKEIKNSLKLKAKVEHTHIEYCDVTQYRNIQNEFVEKLEVLNGE